MQFIFEQPLQDYMAKTGKRTVIVEVAASNCSDFEVTELHVHLINEKQADYFKTKKHFRSREVSEGEVLLPPYRLEYADTITFGLKSFLWIKYVTHKGIGF